MVCRNAGGNPVLLPGEEIGGKARIRGFRKRSDPCRYRGSGKFSYRVHDFRAGRAVQRGGGHAVQGKP